MNQTDIKNRDIILSFFEKNVVLEKQSFDFVNKQLHEPFIDEEYAHNIGSDFRARWEIDFTNLTDKEKKYIEKYDRAYYLFFNYFNSFFSEISYSEFQENLKTVNKNKIKIKKYIEGIYRQNHKRFIKDRSRNFAIHSAQITDNEIEAYILKSFEDIGRYKIPNKKLYLVLSINYADWLLCSTAESWSSCLSLEGQYYHGLFTLPGDLSRALLYVTDGSFKEYLGIKVEKIISRSWVLLGEKNQKAIVKFYPNEFLGLDLIKKITNDNSYIMASNLSSHIKSKNNYVPLFFEKGISVTPYNDRSSLLLSSGGVEQLIKEGSGLTVFDKHFERKNTDTLVKLFCRSFKSYVNEKRNLNQDINYTPKECCKCHNKEVKNSFNGQFYCQTCFTELFTSCKHCGEIMPKDKGEYCDNCKPLFEIVKCSICGTEHYKKDVKLAIIEKTNSFSFVCSNHDHTEKKCLDCGTKHRAFNMIRLHDEHPKDKNKLLGKWRCISCFEKEKDKYETCSVCNELYAKVKIENSICVNCREKM